MKTVNILGTEYIIKIKSKKEDKLLEKCDGYCDQTSHNIVITSEPEYNELNDFKSYQKKVLRHELIHAFLFESGLAENFKHDEWGHDEIMIDWVAGQFPKILSVFQELDCL